MIDVKPVRPPGEVTMSAIAQWCMIVLFLSVLVAIPLLWYFVGRDTYGTGDYYQP